MKKKYSYDEVVNASSKYFNGDQLAAEVFAGKYALRDNEKNILELTPSDMHRRLAREFARIERNYINPLSEDEIYDLLSDWKVVAQGSPMSGIGNDYQIQSLSNCYVIESPQDSYGGILKADQEQAQIMKRRGGVGFDISNIRPAGLMTTNAAKTTDGIGVFMERFSNTCREVAQGGRRGALMLTISCNHPQLETFIDIKQDLKKVTGANISIRLSDEFMLAVKNDTDFTLRWPVTASVEDAVVKKQIKAKDLWDKIISAAWKSAEPGLLFWDTIIRRSPADSYSDYGYRSISTNPCITGDSLIAVADGRNAVTIKQLAEEGVDVPVYSTNVESGQIEVKTGRSPRLTKRSAEIWKLTLDDGSSFKATKDHKVMLRDRNYVELQHLREGMSVFPFNSFNSNGYRQICNTGVKMTGGARRNRRQKNVANEQLLEHGRNVFLKNGKITCSLWSEYAKSNSLPQFLGNKFRFGSFRNFANQVAENHKVISVEYVGIEDVYNITVDDNHNYHVITSHEDDRFITSSGLCVKNCGEIILSANDSCRLLLLNLYKFVKNPFTTKAYFDYEEYDVVVQKAQRLMDDLVDLDLQAVDRIINKIENDQETEDVKNVELELWKKIKRSAKNGRRTGLGITGMGDTLAAIGVKYGTSTAVDTTEKIYRTHALASYRSSINLAKERGAFPVYESNLEKNHEFIEQILSLDPDLRKEYNLYGRRNIANLTTPPAGSVSILTQTTSGIEPVFMLFYDRWRKLTNEDNNSRVDRIDDMGDRWQKYRVYHHGLKEWMKINNKTDSEIEESPYWNSTANNINWPSKIDMQAAAQKWIDHSISNTTNIPNDASIETVKEIYMRGWETGCKGVTIYRDGCRDGVLTSIDDSALQSKDSSVTSSVIVDNHAPKRPKELECDIHRASVKGEGYVVLVGLMNGRPYEIFCGLSQSIEIPKKSKKGVLIKNGKIGNVATYNLQIPIGDDDNLTLKNIVEIFDNPVYGAFSRSLSLALRHGVPVQYLVEQLRKDKDSDITSFNSVIARILSKAYIADGTSATTFEKTCVECGSSTLSYQSGCVTCMNCGNSKCG